MIAEVQGANIRVLHLVQRRLELAIAMRNGREEPDDADRKEAQRTVRPVRIAIACNGEDYYDLAPELEKSADFDPVAFVTVTLPERFA